MAIDYNTGISSLDAGALDITYSGDEGPKSPKQIAGGEYNRVLELLKKIRESGPLSEEEKIELQQLIRTLTAKGIDVEGLMGESGDMRMASTDPMLQDEYDKYVFELQEIHPEAVPMSIEEFKQQAISGMAEGGIARLGYRGGQLVQPGPGRPGYQGDRPPGVRGREAAEESGGTLGGYSDKERFQQIANIRTQELKKELERERLELEPDVKKQPSFLNKARKTMMQNLINSKTVSALRSLGLMKGFGPFTDVPEWAEDRTEDELNVIARTGPYLGAEDAKTPQQLERGSDLLGKVTEAQGLLNKGNLTQPEYERLFSETTPGEGRDPILPIYAQTMPGTEEVTDATGTQIDEFDVKRKGLLYTADGGRIPAAYGGIMDLDTGRRAYGLGSIFKPFKKAAKAIKKVAKSDIGKAALMWAAFQFGPGFLSESGLKMGSGRGLAGWQALMQNPKSINVVRGILGSSALGGLFAEEEDDDSDTLKWHEAQKQKYMAAIGEFPMGRKAPIYTRTAMSADGGRIGYADGRITRTARMVALNRLAGLNEEDEDEVQYAQEGGLMNLGGMEKDYRQEGGFVPLGGEEKADDVPARLSKNEFVFTADAVRAAGGGDIDAGAEVMENVMENLEQGGQVSEESQGLEGARDMFSTAQRLEGVL